MSIKHPFLIVLAGEYDIYNQDALVQQLLPAHDHRFVVIDFRDVRYIDSTALTVLVRMRKNRAAQGYPPAHLCGLRPSVRQIFEVTQLESMWPIFPSAYEAIAAFASHEAGNA